MLYLDNLVSTVVHQGKPWEFKGLIPPGVANDKTKRAAWITSPATKHSVYTAWEGNASNLRINDQKGRDAETGNAPRKLYGLVADYDAKVGPEEIAKGLERLRIKPNWTSTSLSGYCHAVWLFETPLLIPNREWTKPFLEHVMAEMDLEAFLPRFDKKAFLTPDRYYTNSLDWTEVHAEPVSRSLVTGWSIQVSQKFNWDNEGTAVPLDLVREELIKRYGETFWPGDWTEGGQGPTFWVPGSASPKSAIIRATGMQTFASHAHKSFFPWAELVDYAFVREYETKLMGRAVEGIYFDGKHFIRQTVNGQWLFQDKQDLKDHLLVARGLSGLRKNGKPGDADRAVEYIREHNSVTCAVPRAFQAPGVQVIHGKRYLNTFTGKAATPAEGTHVWGKDGSFPWLSSFMEKTFPGEQLEFICAWLHRFYTGCLNNRLESNVALFIVGPANIGKTLFGTGIVARMVGGFEDAQEYLAHGGKFNSELFEVGLWTVDDAVSAGTPNAHRCFGETLKKAVANQNLKSNPKFKTPGVTTWQGGIIVTCNHDANSIRMIPDLNGSIQDKLALLRTSDTGVKFLNAEGTAKMLNDELPGFCAYIRAYGIPEKWAGAARFGVRPYHHPGLVLTAQQSSSYSTFADFIELWRSTYFAGREVRPSWQGTSVEFYAELLGTVQHSAAALGMRPGEITRSLANLLSQKYPGLGEGPPRGSSRIFILDPPPTPPKKKPTTKAPAKKAPTKAPTKKGPSRYAKQ